MSYEDYDAFCASLPATRKVIQWGGAHVWKVGEKVFAIGGWSDGKEPYVTFKCSPQSYDILKEQAGLRPAPYLASRGMKWIQMTTQETLSVDDLKTYIKESHRLAALNLTKKRQKELGLLNLDKRA
ncbi:MAG: MmcQ/YjbR family DNA-binding protein [Pseudomonadota bacterium]